MPAELEWVHFTRRTDDPKLAYLERRLSQLDIPHRRHGFSFHAPILQVPAECLDAAWKLLDEPALYQGRKIRLDDVPDDDPRFL